MPLEFSEVPLNLLEKHYFLRLHVKHIVNLRGLNRMIINAEGWYVLRLPRESQTSSVTYRIFASWRIDDRWRLSSGAASFDRLIFDGSKFIWPQISGNIYYLPLDGESGATFYTANILDRYLSEIGVSLEHVRVDVSELLLRANNTLASKEQYTFATNNENDEAFTEFYSQCASFFKNKALAKTWFDSTVLPSFDYKVARVVIGEYGLEPIRDYLSSKAEGAFE